MSTSNPGIPGVEPGASFNFHDAEVVIDLFDRAAKANFECPLRRGATVQLPRGVKLLMTGDLHDNGINLKKILKLANLSKGPDQHLVLHELIHGKHLVNGMDFSIRMLARVAAIKLEFPNQVHIMFGNHELSQIGFGAISKNGLNVNDLFDQGLEFIYTDQASAVRDAMGRFIRSMLLSVHCPNGILCSHSLPAHHRLETFDTRILYRIPTEQDFRRAGPIFDMVWGRTHSDVLTDELSEEWGVDLFLVGHMPALEGYSIHGRAMLVLASDHAHGVALPINTGEQYTMDELIKRIVPLSSILIS